MTESQLRELEAIYERATPVSAEYFAPTNGLGVPRWIVGGWVRSTTIADEVESGPCRMDGPTKRLADDLVARLNALPAALAEVRRLKAALREACDLYEYKEFSWSGTGRGVRASQDSRIAEIRKEAP